MTSDRSPEQNAAVWASLEALAAKIGDDEVRAQYLGAWRERYDTAFPRWLRSEDIVRLPDWKHVGEISPRERRQARMVSDAWIDAQRPDVLDNDQVRRFCWELGRRARAGLLEKRAAEQITVDVLGSAATSRGAMDAFRRGYASDGGKDAGEALIAAIVIDLRCAAMERNEDGLSQRFRLRHGQNFRHTTAKGWFRWDGRRWRLLEEERGALPAELMAAAGDTIAAIQREAFAVRATGLLAASIPEGAKPDKFRVEVDGVKVPLVDLLAEDGEADPDGLDRLVITPSTCRLLSAALGAWGKAMGELKRYRAMVDLSRRWLTVSFMDFDKDPLTINCQNGTLRLIRHSGDGGVEAEARLDPHERLDLLTRVASVSYDPDAVCPNYDETVGWAQPKPEMRRYLHQWGGYNLTGDMGAQIFHVWWGPLAQNGKSTILDAWADAAGDYAEGGKIESFMEAQAKSGDAATPALVRLPGVRMLRTGEPPANAKFDESLINTITGQDPLLLRDNFRSFFEAFLECKVTVACNAPPSIPNATEGIRRRVKIVPFEKTMKGALKPDGTPLRDPNFKAKLVAEMPGIFRRLVDGALDWLRHGFVEPGDVTEWTDEYKDENDPLGRFLEYCTVIDEAARTQSSKLHELFEAWSKATGGPDWKQTYFTKKMKAKGFSTKASNGMQWLGIRMVRERRDFVDEHGNVIDVSDDAFAGGAGSARAIASGSGGGELPPDDPPDSFDPFGDDEDVPF